MPRGLPEPVSWGHQPHTADDQGRRGRDVQQTTDAAGAVAAEAVRHDAHGRGEHSHAGDRAETETRRDRTSKRRGWASPARAGRRTGASCRRGREWCPSQTTRSIVNANGRGPLDFRRPKAPGPDASRATRPIRRRESGPRRRSVRCEPEMRSRGSRSRRNISSTPISNTPAVWPTAPLQAGFPLLSIAVRRQRSHRRQVVGAREHVDKAGGQAG